MVSDMRFFIAIVVSACTLALTPIPSQRAFAQQSPEEIATHTAQGCGADSQCEIPSSMIVDQGMDPRCLASRCRPTGKCEVEILKDKLLNDFTPEDSKACFVYQYKCGDDGKTTYVEQESEKKAAREGEACLGDASDSNPCVAYICRNKECTKDLEKFDGKTCDESKASPAPNPCQNAQCDSGKCVPIPDPAIKDDTSTSCGDDTLLDDGCQINTKRCNTRGQCLEKTGLRSAAECGPPPNSFMALAENLPQSFKDLFLKDQTPQFSCNPATCKLEYCGDNKINREDQCDGLDMPKIAPLGSRCSADCKIVSPDCSAFKQNPNFLEVANVNGSGTVTYPKDGSFTGSIADVKANLQAKGYTVEVAWEPGDTGGIIGADSLSLHALALCAWKPERRPGCESIGSKPGLKVTALGIPDAESCDSPAAQNAYQKFKAAYVGFESLFTGNNVGFSVSPKEPYIYPLNDEASAPDTMSYCEVCFYAVCGNGVRTEGEECDGKDLGPNAQPGDVCSETCTLGPCQAKPNEPVSCSVDPVTGVGIEIQKSFSIEQCGYEETRTEKPKPQEMCQETVFGLTAVRTTPLAFVAKDGRCEWELKKETITSPYSVRCSIDPQTGKGLQEGSVFDSSTCQWTNTRLLRPRPAPTCRETRANVTAVLKQYKEFVKVPAGGCQWVESAQQINSGVTPGCTEANNKATLTTVKFVSNMQASPLVCRYEPSTKVDTKPLGFCAERGTAAWPKAELVSYVLNKTTCSYAERVDKSTARPGASCQYKSSTKTAEATTYNFNVAKCGYDPVKSTKYQPPDSCGEEVRQGRSYAVSRIYYGSSLDPKTCDFKPTERSTLTPTTYECSARNGQRYQRATLNRTPRVCSYTQVSGSCCYYTLTVGPFKQEGQAGFKGGVGCLSSVVSRASQQCQGRGDMTDDCIAGKVGGNWSADSNCTQGGGSVYCGSAEYVFFPSPVSLRWADDTANKELAFARFSLSDDSQKKVVVWRASSALPLLVYDPSHKGEITSAQQLFGNFFQGGQNGKDPWSDGYEALGSLDADKDGKISGKELEPLGLWFDGNRDGISQPGEVKPLNHHDVNVTALFYKGGAYNTITKDIDLAVGFERIVGGHIEQGASVDWYTEEASSQMELINSLSISSFFARYEKNGESESSAAPMTPTTNAAVRGRTLYQWSTDDIFFMDGKEQKPKGIFSIVELSDGTIRGYLFGESFMKDGDSTISNIGTVKITGRIETIGDGRRAVTFDSVKDTKSGTDTRTTATISADGKTIEGKTTQTLTYEGEEHSFSYSWKGRADQK